jgi:hypothetical protein
MLSSKVKCLISTSAILSEEKMKRKPERWPEYLEKWSESRKSRRVRKKRNSIFSQRKQEVF